MDAARPDVGGRTGPPCGGRCHEHAAPRIIAHPPERRSRPVILAGGCCTTCCCCTCCLFILVGLAAAATVGIGIVQVATSAPPLTAKPLAPGSTPLPGGIPEAELSDEEAQRKLLRRREQEAARKQATWESRRRATQTYWRWLLGLTLVIPPTVGILAGVWWGIGALAVGFPVLQLVAAAIGYFSVARSSDLPDPGAAMDALGSIALRGFIGSLVGAVPSYFMIRFCIGNW
ncbi:MAG: hypothetical protein HYY93_15145 [Planctomycetes bacterium]|nr:hypothetical protein [Planctomycetota bacterium]